jgi:hypothetical protein
VHGVDHIAEGDGGGLEGEGLAVLGEGVIEAALVFVDVAEVVVQVAGDELAVEDAFVVFGGIVGEFGLAEALAAVELHFDKAGQKLGGLAGAGDGILGAAEAPEDEAGHVEGLDLAGVEIEGGLAFEEGGVGLAGAVEGGAEAGVEIGGFGGAGEGGAEDPDGFLVAAEVAEDDAEVALGLDVAGDEAEEFLEVAGGVVEAAEDAEDDALVEEDFSELGFLGAKLLVEGEGFLVAFLFLEDDAEGEVKGGLIAEGEGLADVFFGEGGLAVLEVDAGEEVESVGLVGVGGEDLAEDGLGLGELVGLLVLKGKLDGLVDG